tara:strand:+ start:2294 stop:3130 length:837 start_codon:yes stop_codon:yes gene_type:complete
MIFRIVLITLSFSLILLSCTKKNELIYEESKSKDPYKIYQEANKSFNKRDYFFAAKKFSEAELNFEIVEFAAKSALMQSFCFYAINFYDEALENLDRYLNQYPADKNIKYAKYLIAIIYYEKIKDEKRDLEPLLRAQEKIENYLKEFPENEYTIDLKFKKNLIINQLAAKEMYIGRYYISVQKWIPAIKRFQNVVQNYDQTIFIEEALHRLVEIYYHIGAEEEAKSYASVLGYNYNSSEWFKASYQIMNKDYRIIKQEKSKVAKKKDNFIKKIIDRIK